MSGNLPELIKHKSESRGVEVRVLPAEHLTVPHLCGILCIQDSSLDVQQENTVWDKK